MSKQGINQPHLQKRKTKFITHKFENHALNESINLVSYGVKISKVCKKGKFSHRCIFYILEDDPSFLQWISSKKSYITSRINLSSVSSISDRPNWKLPGKLSKEPHVLCITYGDSLGDNHDLILNFVDSNTKMLFWQGLQHFILKYGTSGADK